MIAFLLGVLVATSVVIWSLWDIYKGREWPLNMTEREKVTDLVTGIRWAYIGPFIVLTGIAFWVAWNGLDSLV